MLQGNRFVISKNLNDKRKKKLLKAIKENEGTIDKKLSSKVNYFISCYNDDDGDDDRLPEIQELEITIVSPEYIHEVISTEKIIDWRDYAYGLGGTKGKTYGVADDVKSLFCLPSLESREIEEHPQSYQEFCNMTDRLTPSKKQINIDIIPLVTSSRKIPKADQKKNALNIKVYLGAVKSIFEAFFGFNVRISRKKECLPKHKQDSNYGFLYNGFVYDVNGEVNPKTKIESINVMDVIDALVDSKSKDTFCSLAVNFGDLYEDHEDIDGGIEKVDVIGRATGDGGGVITISRFLENPTTRNLQICMNTAVHETLHMFGIDHCVYYKCVMNAMDVEDLEATIVNKQGTGVKRPSDDLITPLHLCPIDLRKLEDVCGFDVKIRYENLLRVCTELGFDSEKDWLQKRLHCFK